jgi:hypothetical protein
VKFPTEWKKKDSHVNHQPKIHGREIRVFPRLNKPNGKKSCDGISKGMISWADIDGFTGKKYQPTRTRHVSIIKVINLTKSDQLTCVAS